MKVTKKKLKYWIKDEKMAAKEYHKYGFHHLAKSEESHARFHEKLLRKLKKKKK